MYTKANFKLMLKREKIPLPTYEVDTCGPPRSRLFKGQVTINGDIYTGPSFSPTKKVAEHEAAKVAFMSLPQDGAQEDDGLYKNLLQELAQKEGFLLPVYATNRFGPPHMPYFVSIVEISGESFKGEIAQTKKWSEKNAAKVAYIALTKEKKEDITETFSM